MSPTPALLFKGARAVTFFLICAGILFLTVSGALIYTFALIGRLVACILDK